MPYDAHDKEHTSPVTERDTAIDTDLIDAFHAYREQYNNAIAAENYEMAYDLLEDIRVELGNVHTLIDTYDGMVLEDDDYFQVSPFICACYNHVDDDIIVFDPEERESWSYAKDAGPKLGKDFDWERTLILDGNTSAVTRSNRGLVINRAETGRMGIDSPGITVNLGSVYKYGKTQADEYNNIRSRTAVHGYNINMGETPRFTGENVISRDRTDDPDLIAYLDELEDNLSGPVEDVTTYLTGLDPHPAAAIETRIKTITGNKRSWE